MWFDTGLESAITQCSSAFRFAVQHQGKHQPEASQIDVKRLGLGIYYLPFALPCCLTGSGVLQVSPCQASAVMAMWHGVEKPLSSWLLLGGKGNAGGRMAVEKPTYGSEM